MAQVIKLRSTYKGNKPGTILTVDDAVAAQLLQAGIGATTDLTGGVREYNVAVSPSYQPQADVPAPFQVSAGGRTTVSVPPGYKLSAKGAATTAAGRLELLSATDGTVEQTLTLTNGEATFGPFDASRLVQAFVDYGTVTLSAVFVVGGGTGLANKNEDRPILVIGGDHPYKQHYGTSGKDGLAAMYLDRGLKPYLAVNTAPDTLFPGASADMMTWAQLRAMRDAGVEVISHGHRHIQQWDRLNTGLNIRYNGTGATATVQMSGTVFAGLVNASGADADSFSFDTSLAAYDTLGELAVAIAAINGGGKWTCTLAAELAGAEKSSKILSFATPVIAKGVMVKVAAGGGITIQYTGTVYEQVTVSVAAGLSILADGVLLANLSLTNGNYNTLAKLVTTINALTGFTANLMSNGFVNGTNTNETYLSGNEASSNLLSVTHAPCVSVPAVLNAGLPEFYIRDRLFQASVDTAAANGVALTNFAQSGQGFQAWHVGGHHQFKSLRGNPNNRQIKPFAVPAYQVDSLFRTHKALTLGDYPTAARTKAIIDALVDSGPWYVDLLMHKMIPDGSSGYSLSTTTTADADQVEADFVALLDRAKIAVDAGQLENMTPDVVRNSAQKRAKPRNMLFNPRFKNSGESVYFAGSGTSGCIVPGWQTLVSLANCSAMSIANDAVSVSSSTGGTFSPLSAEVLLEPGKSYEVGMFVDVQSYTSGSGVYLSIAKRRGKFKQTAGPAIAAFSSESTTQSRLLRFVVTMPNRDPYAPAYVKSLNAQTWDLSVDKNIKINIDAKGAIDNVDCSAGAANPAAVTAKEVASAINAAIAANSAYAASSEYHACAKAVAGKVIVQSPYHQIDNTYIVKIEPASTASATTTIFGGVAGGTHTGVAQHAQLPSAEDFILSFNVFMTMVGTVGLSHPYVREINYQV